MHLCLPIIFASVGGIRQLVVQIPSMDAILMGYWMSIQVRTMMSNVMYKSNFRIGNVLGRVLVIPCEILLRYHLRNNSRIAMLVSVRGAVGGLGYVL